MADLPKEFTDRLREIVPLSRLQDCLDSFSTAPATTFQTNRLKADPRSLRIELETDGFSPTPLAWKPDAFQVPHSERRRLTQSAACMEGRLYIQNPASMIPPLVLDPSPEEWILDLAAAPGGKTVQLAGQMGNRGRISAVESVRSRFFRLLRVLELHGAGNVQTYLKDGAAVWRSCPEQFDRVLLDAPCTAEGRFSENDPASFAYWSLKKIREMSRKQRRLMFSAVQSLKPGGVLVYCTCTLAPEENELVVNGALKRFGDSLHLVEVAAPNGNSLRGLGRWRGKELHPDMSRCLRILPDSTMEGFFIARIEKTSSTINLAHDAR